MEDMNAYIILVIKKKEVEQFLRGSKVFLAVIFFVSYGNTKHLNFSFNPHDMASITANSSQVEDTEHKHIRQFEVILVLNVGIRTQTRVI